MKRSEEGDRDETKDYKYHRDLVSGGGDRITVLSGDHIIPEAETVRSDNQRTDTCGKQK